MKVVCILMVCLSISLRASAMPVSDEEIKRGIADAVERYANAISCGGITIRPAAVLTLEPRRDGPSLPRYAVLWSGDLGCFGGSGSERTHLAIAMFNTGRYVVQPELSSPVVAFESPVRFVARTVSNSADTLVLEGLEYGAADPQSNPSIPVRFTLRLDAKGNWKLIDKIGI
jgi:hypothetical protein